MNRRTRRRIAPSFASTAAAWFLAAGALGCGLPTTACAVDQAVLDAEARRIEVVEKIRPAVLAVFSRDGGGGGSGVVISPDGYALSNFHVTKGAGDAMKCGMPDGNCYDAVIVGIDATGDVALIKLLGRDDFPYAELGDSDTVQVGDWAFAVGNPFLLATDFQPTYTYGIVSGVHRYQYPAGTLLEYADCIQTDAAINPGNSGGPLFDAEGKLIGINGRGSFEKRGRVNVGVGYAISINQIKNFLGHLKSGRVVDHATLGARVASDDQGRVIVSDVIEESDAWRRGLRYGDEIVAFGGRPIRSVNAFKNTLGIFPKGWRVPLTYRRGAERYEVLVRLDGVHRESELWAKVQGRPPDLLPKEPPKERQPQPDEKDNEQTPEDVPANPQEKAPGDPERPRVMPRRVPRPGGPQPRRPAGARSGEADLPEIVRQHYERKTGYANYHFNRLQQERLTKALAAAGDFSELQGAWELSGELINADKASFELTDAGVLAALPGGQAQIAVSDDLTQSLDPIDSGGLLAALHLWRHLLIHGLDGFDQAYYLGVVPVPGRDHWCDVLVTARGGVECHFLFDPPSGQLIGLEMFADEYADPCTIYFSEYDEANGRQLPRRFEVRHGDELYGLFEFDEFKLTERPASP